MLLLGVSYNTITGLILEKVPYVKKFHTMLLGVLCDTLTSSISKRVRIILTNIMLVMVFE